MFARRSLLLITTVIGYSATAALADPAYYQNFPANSNGSGSLSLSGYNWAAYYGNSTTNTTTAVAGPGTSVPNGQVSSGGSATSAYSNINAAAPASTTVTKGVAFVGSPNNTNQYLLETNEFKFVRANSDPQNFSWFAGSQTAGDTEQLAIEIGTQWYAANGSDRVFTLSGGVSGANLFTGAAAPQETTNFTTAASAWRVLNFNTDNTSTLSLGAPLTTPLPSGDIIGFGVYMTSATSSADKIFVDNFAVDTPEPVVLAPALAGLALLRRRRR